MFRDLELYCTCILLLKRPDSLGNYLICTFNVIFKASLAAIKEKIVVFSFKITLNLNFIDAGAQMIEERHGNQIVANPPPHLNANSK